MSRGKPKGIARKLATDMPEWLQKVSVCVLGEAGAFPEALILLQLNIAQLGTSPDDIANMPHGFEFPLSAEERDRLGNKIGREGHDQSLLKLGELCQIAASANDYKFFERIAFITKFFKERRKPVDELGLHILLAWLCLKRLGFKASSTEITKFLGGLVPKAPVGNEPAKGYDDGEIRRAMRDLGFPKGGHLKLI